MTNIQKGPSLRDISQIGHQMITDLVPSGSKVLDVGCDDGALMLDLEKQKQVDARGVEILQSQVNKCVSKGLAVVQGDADTDLAQYPTQGFDYAIMSQVIQATRDPRAVLEQLLRIGQHAIVSFPNFAHWRVRANLLFRGQMPVTKKLPYSWYDTPNIHFCTIVDFLKLCEEIGAQVEKVIVLNASGQQISQSAPLVWKNLTGEQALVQLKKSRD